MNPSEREPEVVLARQFITVACLDYIALTFPQICQTYLRRWYHTTHGSSGAFSYWQHKERRELGKWLSGMGYGLAQLVDMDTYVERARRAKELPDGAAMALAIENGQYTSRKSRNAN